MKLLQQNGLTEQARSYFGKETTDTIREKILAFDLWRGRELHPFMWCLAEYMEKSNTGERTVADVVTSDYAGEWLTTQQFEKYWTSHTKTLIQEMQAYRVLFYTPTAYPSFYASWHKPREKTHSLHLFRPFVDQFNIPYANEVEELLAHCLNDTRDDLACQRDNLATHFKIPQTIDLLDATIEFIDTILTDECELELHEVIDKYLEGYWQWTDEEFAQHRLESLKDEIFAFGNEYLRDTLPLDAVHKAMFEKKYIRFGYYIFRRM